MILPRLAPAKINLYLHITGLREDGYHLLDSMAVFAENVADEIIVENNVEKFSLEITGPYAGNLISCTNIIERMSHWLDPTQLDPLKVSLVKNIPTEAGLAGGSSDAAHFAHLWQEFSQQEIDAKGLAKIGADVPTCYYSKANYFAGIGEDIEIIPNFPESYVVLVNPGVGLNTKQMFANWDQKGVFSPTVTRQYQFADAQILAEFLSECRNDFTSVAIEYQPIIAELIQLLAQQDKCLYTNMSGSGSTCFGLFAESEQAISAARQLQNNHPEWWVKWSRVS
jgi:4-diphosphocytidyl-2-C-methyl-D-erythritol kinase